MPWEIIGRTFLGILLGVICGLVSLIIGLILGNGNGGAISMFICIVSGGVFGFIEKSAVLTIIVAIISVLFMLADRSDPTTERNAAESTKDLSGNEAANNADVQPSQVSATDDKN